jgi:hypothetical protein
MLNPGIVALGNSVSGCDSAQLAHPNARCRSTSDLIACVRVLIQAASASFHSADLRLLTVSAVVRRRALSAWSKALR